MIFRQLIDRDTYTYTYILGCEQTRETIIIDPVRFNVQQYLKLLRELDLKLIYAVDTHVHADHVTAAGILRKETGCDIVLGGESAAQCATKKVFDGDILTFGNYQIKAIYTPGHTDDSYCFITENMLFTGDTLLIRGSGRTDFQNGDSYAAYESIMTKLMTLPGSTIICPGHDYNGVTSSSVAEEKRNNPRLQVNSPEEYAKIMDDLKLPPPNYIDIAVPANLKCGIEEE
ncbi:metallo-beta-lactamase superfamily protein [Francisella philomiragia subsp. philomiragia ATCC 25015]|uniref:MBL fold metallo-hydrolase n=1 Tax=Francisella philomiragia TaxID=28110 RepID=UPI0001AF7C39|nr:MBL fold metallo-hydrolase [Francisella philomiragia]AJI75873.1 metallo-beta-lactamase superfamily protein [Francisella philomiragia subsp. philomiragia ATCC 25015]EET21061.1 Zn-dependent hydrolase [Francisella philomiragia subsp. philomiragia ATCC 25015]MBK2238541.1 MBL fold metallo-hydrolase [Francisella philomiragia]